MIGVRLVIGIVVCACVGKIVGAISKLMNMEAIKGWNIRWGIKWQMEELRIENDPFIWGIIKPDDSGNVRVGMASVYQSVCIWRCIHHISTNGNRIREFAHKKPQDCFMIVYARRESFAVWQP